MHYDLGENVPHVISDYKEENAMHSNPIPRVPVNSFRLKSVLCHKSTVNAKSEPFHLGKARRGKALAEVTRGRLR